METKLAEQTEKEQVQEAQRTLYRKLVEDQRAVRQYFRGECTLEQLHARGIRFVKPI